MTVPRQMGLRRAGGRRRDFARGWTLLEVLLVIALLLGLLGIVLPNMMPALGERAFESTADAMGEQFVMSRAHAQLTGRSVEVVYEPESSTLIARYFDPARAADLLEGEPGALGEDDEPVDDSMRIARAWSQLRVHDNIFVLDRQPSEEFIADMIDADPDIAAEIGSQATQMFRLVAFVPDGSALLSSPVWLLDTERRVGRVTINPWTGTSTFERLADLSEGDDPLPTVSEDEELEQRPPVPDDLMDGEQERAP